MFTATSLLTSLGLITGPNLAGIPMNVRISETHTLSADVSAQVIEWGAPVQDHVVLKPRELMAVYEQTNAFQGVALARNAWNAFKKLWQARTPVDVVTEHDLYEDMIVENVTVLHASPNRGAAMFTVTMKQISFITLSYVKVSESQLDPSVAKTGSSEVSGGQVNALKILGGL